MSSPLDEACAILDDFERKIVGVKAIWEQLAEDNPHFEQVSPENRQEKWHRMWLHEATNVSECNELERWLRWSSGDQDRAVSCYGRIQSMEKMA